MPASGAIGGWKRLSSPSWRRRDASNLSPGSMYNAETYRRFSPNFRLTFAGGGVFKRFAALGSWRLSKFLEYYLKLSDCKRRTNHSAFRKKWQFQRLEIARSALLEFCRTLPSRTSGMAENRQFLLTFFPGTCSASPPAAYTSIRMIEGLTPGIAA